jgi:hypothetical protein
MEIVVLVLKVLLTVFIVSGIAAVVYSVATFRQRYERAARRRRSGLAK